MKLIVGGESQGKLDFALLLTGDTAGQEPVADGEKDALEAAFQRKIIDHLHQYIRRFCMEEGAEEAQTEAFIRRLVRENHDAVVISNELGCGIVPLEKKDRIWRELCGNACQILARESGEVYRVVCGLPMRLKGGEV